MDEVLRELPDAPVASSRGRPWAGLTLDLHGAAAKLDQDTAPRDHHVVFCCRGSASGRLLQQRDGSQDESVLRAGDIILLPAGCGARWVGDAIATARLRLPTSLMTEAADEADNRGSSPFELMNRFRARDAFIEGCTALLVAELTRPPHPLQALISEGLSCALAAHLLRRHNALQPGSTPPLPGLERYALERVRAYVAASIGQLITLADLAAVAGVSRFHFARRFKASMGISPMRYVERSRIDHARQLLGQGQLPLAEVALSVGFADQSHFTRRFRQHTGHTPAAYARERGQRGEREDRTPAED